MLDGDLYCAACGSERARTECPECGAETREGAVFCVKCGNRLVSNSTAAAAQQPVSAPRSNHEAIWYAVMDVANTGQVLSTRQIIDRVQRRWPDVNLGSILPNDHAVDNGNTWACRCTRGEGGMSPIFEREVRGRYRVLSRPTVGQESNPSTHGVPTDFSRSSAVISSEASEVLASTWLRDNAVQALQSPEVQVRVLRGTRGGRWLAVGANLPPLGPLEGREPAFAVGMDIGRGKESYDYTLGQPPREHLIYLGIRCNGYLPWGPAGEIYQLVKNVADEFPWRQKDQYWPVWFEPSPFQEDGTTPLTAREYVTEIRNSFTLLYPRIYAAIQDRWSKREEWEDSLNRSLPYGLEESSHDPVAAKMMPYAIEKLLQSLDEQERMILRRRFGLDGTGEIRTLEDVGAEMGLSRASIREIERSAMNKLRVEELTQEFSRMLQEMGTISESSILGNGEQP